MNTIQLDGNISLIPDVLLEVLELVFAIHNTVVFTIHYYSPLQLRNIDILILEERRAGSQILLNDRFVHNLNPHRFNRRIAVECARIHGCALKRLTMAELNGLIHTATAEKPKVICRLHQSSY